MCTGAVKADTYPEVIFDNSLISGVYAKSEVMFSGGSWMENVNAHLPVSDTVYFTPGNALSLRYESVLGGHWEALVKYGRQKYHYQAKSSDVLVLKVFVQSGHTKVGDLPKIAVKQRNGSSLMVNLQPFIEQYLTNTWLDIRIPMSKIGGINFEDHIEGILFYQNGVGAHHVFVDQIEFLPSKYPNVSLSSPAVLSSVLAYDKHVHLQWQMPLTPSIRYVKIYRSEDNKLFEPIGIRPVNMQGGFDNVPLLNKKYYYKIAWVDYNYKESPYSSVIEVESKPLSNDNLLNLVQLAHVNYFAENFDINSGMYLPFHMKERAIVSTNETGLALLSLIVGVERGFVNKKIFTGRVRRIVDFLEAVPNKHGVFASYYNGRTQLPEYIGDQKPHYSVRSSTSMMEALLIVRQYLDADNEEEKLVRDKITMLWDRIDWPSLVLADTEDVLVADVGVIDELSDVRPLGGFNESMNTYILAAASTKNGISPTGFLSNLDVEFEPIQSVNDSILSDSMRTNLSLTDRHLDRVLEDDIEALDDSLTKRSLLRDTTLFGVQLCFGPLDQRSLMEVYRPFLTICPSRANTSKYQFDSIVKSYTKYVKRRDNHNASGVANVDVWGYHSFADSVSRFRINPAISISSIAFDHETGVNAMLSLYHNYGDILFTEYGFRSWLDISNDDVSDEYLTLNQAMVAVMIENARSGLIWELYDDIPEIKSVKEKIFVQNNLP